MTLQKLARWMESMPIVAILRGVTPAEADDIGAAVFRAGIGIIEVPLNSPEPLVSIRSLARSLGQECVIGAGTVLTAEAVDQVADAGGEIIVSPNTNTAVITRAIERGLAPLPGWATPSEAFAAYHAGARYLKLFPAATYGPAHIRASRAVLPADAHILAVGGAGAHNLPEWLEAGAAGFGIGSELYKPGTSAEQVFATATRLVSALNEARNAPS